MARFQLTRRCPQEEGTNTGKERLLGTRLSGGGIFADADCRRLLIDWANLGSVWGGQKKWESASHLRGELQVCIKKLISYYTELRSQALS